MKLQLARVLERCGVNGALFSAQSLLRSPYIRAVNYHEIPRSERAAFEAQLVYYQRHFEPVGLAELEAFLAGSWRPKRPGLILSFDDGLRSHAEIAAPLLEQYGFPGWFCVPAGLPDAACEDPQTLRRRHDLIFDEQGYPDRRGVLDWEEVRRLDRHHVIVCHSFSHRRLSADLAPADFEFEVAKAKAHLEEQLGHRLRVFAWVGGEEPAYSSEGAALIRRAGFDYALMTNSAAIRPWTNPHQLQRTNVESSDPPEWMRFSLSGLLDLVYWAKRRRVNRLTAP